MSTYSVWCLLRDQFGHVKPVEAALGAKAEFIYDADWLPDRMLKSKPDIVVCVNDTSYEVAECIFAARQNGIPSVVVQDGILEWRCQYENPAFGAGGGAPQHQPVLADKIACIGFQSARQIIAWGNADKVEVTGMPRLDYIREINPVMPRRSRKRILVMTAKKPGFTESQIGITLRSLVDLRDYFSKHSEYDVIWRITKGLDASLGVENNLQATTSQELIQLIGEVDAVISTPSTAMLEAMLMSRPVACLDYHNTPHFVQTAWTISAEDHIDAVVNELCDPPNAKVAFQTDRLRDALLIIEEESASSSVARLIDVMVVKGREARAQKCKVNLPPDMLERLQGSFIRSKRPDLRDLYPAHEVFGSDESLEELQLRHARLQKQYFNALNELDRRSLGYYAQRLVHKVSNLFR